MECINIITDSWYATEYGQDEGEYNLNTINIRRVTYSKDISAVSQAVHPLDHQEKYPKNRHSSVLLCYVFSYTLSKKAVIH